MKDIALFVLLGLGAGAVIAGIAMAVVITYRGSGIINLATGAVAMVAAYGFWALKSDYFGFTLGDRPGGRRHDGWCRSWSACSASCSCSARCERRRRSPSWSPRSGSC